MSYLTKYVKLKIILTYFVKLMFYLTKNGKLFLTWLISF